MELFSGTGATAHNATAYLSGENILRASSGGWALTSSRTSGTGSSNGRDRETSRICVDRSSATAGPWTCDANKIITTNESDLIQHLKEYSYLD